MGLQAMHHFRREWNFVFTQPWNYMTICFIKFTHQQFGDPTIVDQFRNILPIWKAQHGVVGPSGGATQSMEPNPNINLDWSEAIG